MCLNEVSSVVALSFYGFKRVAVRCCVVMRSSDVINGIKAGGIMSCSIIISGYKFSRGLDELRTRVPVVVETQLTSI